MSVIVNGVTTAQVECNDRGLLYGDGLFETLRIENGAPRFWQSHMARLASGCMRLGIQGLDYGVLEQEASRLATGVARGVLKIVITRGSGDRGYRPGVNCVPTRILQIHSLPEYPPQFKQEGITARVCSTRLGCNPLLAGIKHLNRLEQVMARAEWRESHVAEGIMLDSKARVVGGTMTNIFFVSDGALCTPDLAESGVAGVTRQRILEWARNQTLPVRVARYTLDDLLAAAEVFVCNSLVGVWPVTRLDAKNWPVGDVTRRAMGFADKITTPV